MPNIPTPQIIAIGGAGFAAVPRNLELDRYILEQTGRKRPSVAFVGTASGDADLYLARFYAAYSELDCRPAHLPLFARTPDPESFLLSRDVIFVGGGNTRSMLAVWREWGIPDLLRKAWESGIVLAGISAGAICWFRQGVTDSHAEQLTALNGLGFLPESCCPHYDSEPDRRPSYHRLLEEGKIRSGFAIDDGAALHFRGTAEPQAVAQRPAAGVYRVGAMNGKASEEPMPVRYLDGG